MVNYRARLNISLLLVSIFIGAVLLESTVRFFRLGSSISHNLSYHPQFGWTQRPGVRYQFQSSFEKITVEFNSLGFRDVERSFPKPPGIRRVVVIGDSFCEAVQVNREDAFPYLLEKKLNQTTGASWEVINLCVGDFGPAQEWLVLRELGIHFTPDAVVHLIFPLNDICNDNVAFFDVCKSSNDRFRPYWVIRPDGGWKWITAQPVRNGLRRHWASYRALEFLFLKASGGLENRSEKKHMEKINQRGWGDFNPLLQAYNPSPSPIVETGWLSTERTLETVNDFLRAKNIPYLPVVVPFEGTLPSNWDSFNSGFSNLSLERLYPEKRLSAFFDKRSVPYILLQDVFKEYPGQLGRYRDGHFNPAMHRITGEAISRRVGRLSDDSLR